MPHTTCPDCGETMTGSDSGEPEYTSGWYCDNCQTFWADDVLEDIWEQEAAEYEADDTPDDDTPVDHVFNPDRPDLMTDEEYQDWLHRSGGD